MKSQWIAALAGATFAYAAAAQDTGGSTVQIYGVLDTGIEHIDHVGASGASVTRMPSLSGGQLPSRLGFRGSEDLGGGLRTIFTLESGFGVDNGNVQQGGRFFGRQAFVGVSGDWGTFSMGRHWTMVFYSMLEADVIGPAIFGLAALDNYMPQARSDKSLSYRGTFSGWTVGGTYSFGRDFAPPANCPGDLSTSQCRAWSAMLKYDGANWGVAAAYDRQNNGANGGFFGQPAGTVANAGNVDRRTILDGYYKFAAGGRIGAGMIRRRFSALPIGARSDLYFAGINYPLPGTPISIDAQILTLRDHARVDANATSVVLRGNYALSRRTWLYAMLGHVGNDGNAAYAISAGELTPSGPVAGRGQTGMMVGMRHSF
jgi:predicted porin